MLFMLPILDTGQYLEEQIVYQNSIALMVSHYNSKKSWLAYQNAVKVSIANADMVNSLDMSND